MKIKEAVAKRITDLCKERNIAINALCSMLSFCYQIVNFQAKYPLVMRFFGLYDLFPLHGSGGFGSYIVDYSVYVLHFVCYSV